MAESTEFVPGFGRYLNFLITSLNIPRRSMSARFEIGEVSLTARMSEVFACFG